MTVQTQTKWQIIIPEEATNLVYNSSVEYDTTDYTAESSVISRSNADSKWGAYSLKCVVSGGAQKGFNYTNTNVTLTSGTPYKMSIYMNIPDGNDMLFRIWEADNTPITVFTFEGTGRWERYTFDYTEQTSTGQKIFIFLSNTSDTITFYADGFNIVASSDLHTYIDGDQGGCVWNGAEHASTSTRDDSYRLGGKIINLADLDLRIKTQAGIGMLAPTHITQEYANKDGAIYQGSFNRPRAFQLTAQILSSGVAHMHMQRDSIINALKINRTGEQQELLLRYTGANTVREIKTLYEDGLSYQATNQYNEVLPLRFLSTDPYFYDDGEAASGLTPATTVSGTYAYVGQRDKDGSWSNLSSTFNAAVYAIAYDKRHNLYYLGGTFTSPQTGISKYDPSTGSFSALGTGAAGGSVFSLAVDETNGDLYAGGTFTSMGGVANTARIARYSYSGAAWTSVHSGISTGSVVALAFDYSRNLYVGGTFTGASAVSNTARIAKYSITTNTFTALGTGMDAQVNDLALSPDGYIYAVGYFLQGNSVTLNGIGKWNGTTFEAVGSGIDSAIPLGESLAFGADGTLYIGFFGNTLNGVSGYNYVAKWNGSQWLPLSTGFDATPYVIRADDKGNMLFGGQFTTAGGLSVPAQAVVWNGSAFYPIGLKIVNGNIINDMHVKANGTVTFGWGSQNPTLAETVTTVTNDGSADAYPRIIIDGPTSGTATLYFIKNNTTGDALYFNTALTVNTNERLVLDLANKSFTSNFQGNLNGKLLPGSNIGKFRLISGANKISFFASSTSITVNIVWKDKYLSVDGGALAS